MFSCLLICVVFRLSIFFDFLYLTLQFRVALLKLNWNWLSSCFRIKVKSILYVCGTELKVNVPARNIGNDIYIAHILMWVWIQTELKIAIAKIMSILLNCSLLDLFALSASIASFFGLESVHFVLIQLTTKCNMPTWMNNWELKKCNLCHVPKFNFSL